MPFNNDYQSDQWRKDLEIFKKYGFNEEDLKEFYIVSDYIKFRRKDKKEKMYINVYDFIEFYLYLANLKTSDGDKRFSKKELSFLNLLDWFERLYFNKILWVDVREPYLSIKEWYKSKIIDNNLANTKKANSYATPSSHHYSPPNSNNVKSTALLLAAEENSIPLPVLTQLQKGGFVLTTENFYEFYRLPWFWHYGSSEDAIKLKNFIAKPLKDTRNNSPENTDPFVIEANEKFIFIELELKTQDDLGIKPGLSVSSMDAAFGSLKGKTFRMLGSIEKILMPELPIKFYRMP